MRLAPTALLVLLSCGPAVPRTVGSGAALVRVATWNVHDLFDEVDQLVPPGALDTVEAPAAVETKLDRVAAVLRRLDADVVLLQEVENRPLLGRLAARAGYAEARLVEGNDPRGIDVALLSRLPVLDYQGHAAELAVDGTRLWPRDAVEAVLATGGQLLVLLGTHLSSGVSDPSGVRRANQAARLRELADQAAARRPAALVVVGGDLNDEGDSAALAPLLGDGRWVDPAVGLPRSIGWTWSGGGVREVLDHLALRAEGGAAVLGVEVAAGADVAAASDHRPVVLDLLVR